MHPRSSMDKVFIHPTEVMPQQAGAKIPLADGATQVITR